MSTKPEVTPIPDALVRIAYDATFKIGALARVFARLGADDCDDIAIWDLASRIEELNTVVMRVLGDDASPADASELYREVHRRPMPEPEEECVD